jgi:hypothetical protein
MAKFWICGSSNVENFERPILQKNIYKIEGSKFGSILGIYC